MAAFARLGREVRAFVPIQAQPAEVFIHGADEFRLASLVVQVFIAEDKASASGTGTPPRYPESPGMSQMQVAGGRWRKPPAISRQWRRAQAWLTHSGSMPTRFAAAR